MAASFRLQQNLDAIDGMTPAEKQVFCDCYWKFRAIAHEDAASGRNLRQPRKTAYKAVLRKVYRLCRWSLTNWGTGLGSQLLALMPSGQERRHRLFDQMTAELLFCMAGCLVFLLLRKASRSRQWTSVHSSSLWTRQCGARSNCGQDLSWRNPACLGSKFAKSDEHG